MKDYLLKYRSHIFIMGLFVFLIHGAKLNSDVIGIDTEDLIRLQGSFYDGWMQTGRYGLVGLKYLFGNEVFNPYFAGLMTVILFAAAVSAFIMLWDDVFSCKREKAGILPWIAGGLLWISQPAMVEQFYFSLQSMEICIGILLTVAALRLTMLFVKRRNILFGLAAVLLLLITFSTYQIFVVLYIFGTVSVLLATALKEADERNITGGELLKHIIPFCIVFLVGFFLNTLINSLFFASSDYLQNQVMWGQVPFKDCFLTIAGHVLKVFTGYDGIFYSACVGILSVMDLVLLIMLLRRRKEMKVSAKAVVLFFYFAMLVTPFMMTIVIGGAPAMRSQMVLPVVTGFLGYLCICFAQKNMEESMTSVKFAKAILVLGAFVCIWGGISQAKVSCSLYYTDRCRYEHDFAVAQELIQKIKEINFEDKDLPVVVVGKKEFEGNHSCVYGEVIGHSFFDYDTNVEPMTFWSTRRVLGFMHSLGLDCNQIPVTRIEEALEYSLYMPGWPYDGCVQEIEGMIVVKLSHYE